MKPVFRRTYWSLAAVLGASFACAPAAPPSAPVPAGTATLPLKHAPQPTVAAITPGDLMTRLYIIADDSMMGREAGTAGNVRATDYIAGQVRQMGLEPAGENGTYFQTIPMVGTALAPDATLSVDGAPLALWSDYAPLPQVSIFSFGTRFAARSVPTVYGGQVGGEMIAPAQAAGKLVIFGAPTGENGQPDWRFWTHGDLGQYSGAAGVAIAALDATPPPVVEFLQQPQESLADSAAATSQRPLGMLITTAAAGRLLGAPLAGLKPGAAGKTVSGNLAYAQTPTPFPARNVVAVLPGSDPARRGEYVAIGAHNDHIGVSSRALDHDSLRAFNRVMRPRGAEDQPGQPTAEQAEAIRVGLAPLRQAGPARLDSINNGADDDGSGTVSVLEIAQSLANRPQKPRRSILFVWHTAEEKGLYGSEYFTDHPTVPRDSIVAQLNIDMIGRGGAGDLPGGGPSYLQLVGSRRLSTQLGDVVEAENTRGKHGFTFDYTFDANGHPDNIYCRSDHYSYARYGIPVTFFTTGGHQDYHQLTDEPQYIDYAHMARVAEFIKDVAVDVADLDHRPVVDKPKPDPHGSCQQ